MLVWLFVSLTAAHVGFLHDPDVRAALVTRLHDADLIVDKTMIQEALCLMKHGQPEVQPNQSSLLWRIYYFHQQTYTFMFAPPLFSSFGKLKDKTRL